MTSGAWLFPIARVAQYCLPRCRTESHEGTSPLTGRRMCHTVVILVLMLSFCFIPLAGQADAAMAVKDLPSIVLFPYGSPACVALFSLVTAQILVPVLGEYFEVPLVRKETRKMTQAEKNHNRLFNDTLVKLAGILVAAVTTVLCIVTGVIKVLPVARLTYLQNYAYTLGYVVVLFQTVGTTFIFFMLEETMRVTGALMYGSAARTFIVMIIICKLFWKLAERLLDAAQTLQTDPTEASLAMVKVSISMIFTILIGACILWTRYVQKVTEVYVRHRRKFEPVTIAIFDHMLPFPIILTLNVILQLPKTSALEPWIGSLNSTVFLYELFAIIVSFALPHLYMLTLNPKMSQRYIEQDFVFRRVEIRNRRDDPEAIHEEIGKAVGISYVWGPLFFAICTVLSHATATLICAEEMLLMIHFLLCYSKLFTEAIEPIFGV